MKNKLVFLGLLLIFFLLKTGRVLAISISNINVASSTVRVYEKYEVKFNVNTSSEYPFFQYDPSPPPGVTPGVGITVEGIFTTPSGKTLNQPAFYMVETSHTGTSGSSMRFYETGNKYWVLRFSPQEQGTYQVKIKAQDASGTTEINVGSFTATAPVKDGFIRVSKNDSRYFEFSNGKIYWPIGPAWVVNHSANPNSRAYDYSQYKDTGQNLDRFWMIGVSAYSGVGSRWISSAEKLGNEGYMPRLNYNQHYPGHELSYEIFYPEGYRIWLTSWEDELLGPRIKKNTTYQVKLVFKAQNLSGPSNRCSSCDWGFVIKTHNSDIVWANPTMAEFENALRNATEIISHQQNNHDWQILTKTFTAPADTNHIDLYLDNVSAGQVYIDEFSLIDMTTGGEIIRQKRADIHTYVDPKGAGFIDWQVENAEQNGVFLRYVVHDKNDWIQNHLKTDGTWTTRENAAGYYQPENTKARWLVRQWYRYLIARWGYSTAIQSWELNNEGPPNSTGTDSSCGCQSSPHWKTAQAFAKFMHENDAHPHLASTSFWCCWRPGFWGCPSCYPDIDFADIHDYLNPVVSVYSEYYDINNPLSPYQEVEWYEKTAELVSAVGKPVIRGETGIEDGNGPMPALKNANPGIYYHNMLWVQLHSKVMFDPNYWWQEHLSKINREEISKVFWNFVKNLDLNKGGFVEAGATSNNSKVKIYGQKNVNSGKAYLWVWHSDHTWKEVMDSPNADYSLTGNVSLTLKPNTAYTVEWWDTYNYRTTPLKTQTISSNSSGTLTFSTSGYSNDIAIKILGGGGTSLPGDVDGNGRVNVQDLKLLLSSWLGTGNCSGYNCDLNSDGKINAWDAGVVFAHL